ncbi:MAG: precorrin-8X methylmutase [Bacillota bacterium]|nr:precorrin-8X methylmutase [Bacillota bacterium]
MEYKHILPGDIEKTSMSIIEGELAEMGIKIDESIRPVMYRVIHTSADFDYVKNLRITDGAVEAVVEKLRTGGLTFITDTNMALSGINKSALSKTGNSACCYMAEPDIAVAAKERGTTRAAVSMERGLAEYPEGIFVSGNAPTALITISEMIRQGHKPSMVIGVPVGFVNVVESKEELLQVCEEFGIPAIIALGRKGGSNVAASICNALLYMASDGVDPDKRY